MKGDTGLHSAGTGKNKTQVIYMAQRFYLLADAWQFMRERKKWWLLPIIVMLLLAGILIVVGQSSSISPFIYALF